MKMKPNLDLRCLLGLAIPPPIDVAEVSSAESTNVYGLNCNGHVLRCLQLPFVSFLTMLLVLSPNSAIGSAVYWTDSGQDVVRRSSLDGSNSDTVVRGQGSQTMRGIAVDAVAGFVFWGECDGLFRAELNGDDPHLIIDGGDCNLARDIAVDPTTRQIYFNSFERISRANYDGSDMTTIFEGKARGVSLDLQNGYVYWGKIEGFGDSWFTDISRAALDGSNVENVVSTDGWLEATAVSPETNEIFWTDSFNGEIRVADLREGNVSSIAKAINPRGIAYDWENAKVYWTDWVTGTGSGSILRVNSDGTDEELIVSRLDIPRRLAILETAVPEPMGDFDGDSDLDGGDIDALVGEIVSGTNDSLFDLTADGAVNGADLSQWLSDAATVNGFAATYLLGDANLDGTVNASDLNALGFKWQQELALWSAGDFNADGTVNAGDLNVLGQNWQLSIPAAASPESVPEPSAFSLLLLGIIATPLLRRWR